MEKGWNTNQTEKERRKNENSWAFRSGRRKKGWGNGSIKVRSWEKKDKDRWRTCQRLVKRGNTLTVRGSVGRRKSCWSRKRFITEKCLRGNLFPRKGKENLMILLFIFQPDALRSNRMLGFTEGIKHSVASDEEIFGLRLKSQWEGWETFSTST